MVTATFERLGLFAIFINHEFDLEKEDMDPVFD